MLTKVSNYQNSFQCLKRQETPLRFNELVRANFCIVKSVFWQSHMTLLGVSLDFGSTFRLSS